MMPVRLFLKTTSVITSLIGLTLIIFPSFIENFFVSHPSHGGDIFIRFLGSTLFGYACLNWFTAEHDDKQAMRSTFIANLTTLTIAFFISLFAVIYGALNAKGWLIVAMHLTFALGFATYILQIKTER